MGVLENSAQMFGVFLLILARVGCVTMTAPAFLGHNAPVMIRGLLAVFLSFLVIPICQEQAASLPDGLVPFSVMMIREAMLGLLAGLSLLIFFSAMQIAGQVVGQVSGLQLAEFVDSSSHTSMPITSRLMELLALAIFLTMNGHHQVIEAVLTSFRHVPPGTAMWTESFTSVMLEAIRQSFELGLRAAAPILVAVLLAVTLVGLLGRVIPQVNILAIGFSMNTLVVLGMLCFSAGSAAWLFHQQLEPFLVQLNQVLIDR